MKYAVKFRCKEVRTSDGSIITYEGETMWLIEGSWWTPTSLILNDYWATDYTDYDNKLITFDSREAAEEFMKGWGGHPWKCVPKDWEVLEVKPKYKQCGWEPKN